MRKDNRQIPQINERLLRYHEVILISETGENLGVMRTYKALNRAKEVELDLVLVKEGDMPICKLLDYHKKKYEESKKPKQKEVKLKEYKFHFKIHKHDIEVLSNKINSTLTKGNKVKLACVYSWREQSFVSLIKDKFLDIVETFKETWVVEEPKEEGRMFFTIISPK